MTLYETIKDWIKEETKKEVKSRISRDQLKEAGHFVVHSIKMVCHFFLFSFEEILL
jgi:hypothetical protein